MALREELFEDACGLFYEALAAPDLLPIALQLIADAAGSLSAMIIPVGLGPGAAISDARNAGYLAEFVAGGWETKNSRMQRGLAMTRAGKRGLITDTDMFRPEELKTDPFYNEFLVPRRMGANAGMVLAHSGPNGALPITFDRRTDQGPFQPSEIAVMNRYMAHLRPAAEAALLTGLAQTKQLADSLSAGGIAVVLFSARGEVLHSSPLCDRFIGDAFQIRARQIVSWHAATNTRLNAAIRRATSRESILKRIGSEVWLPRRSGKRPLKVQLIPMVRSAHDVFMLARAAMLLTDTEPVRPSPEAVDHALAAYGLTNAERRLAARIAVGETLDRAALAESITAETARSRLKSVFRKTDTHRQVELALLIAALLR